MSCCSSSPKKCLGAVYAPCLARIAFGLVLFSYGANHLRFISGFVEMSKSVYPSVPALGSVMGLIAYIVPLVMMVGGILFIVKQMPGLSKLCILGSLSGIIAWASLAVLVGDERSTGAMMPMIQNAAVMIVLYFVIKKMSCCAAKSCLPGTSSCCSSAEGSCCSSAPKA